MTLDTLTPDPTVGDDAFEAETLAALGADEYVFKVWGGDWCIDCKEQLPAFGAALAAADVPDDRIEHYPVTKTPNGKEGPGVEEYGIDLIPTVVVENATGEEVARFVEDADDPIATYLGRELANAEATA